MATSAEVLRYLIPNGGYSAMGEDYDGINFIECKPITETQFAAGFAKYDAWKAESDAKAATDKAALLAKLGISADEAKLLLN